MAALFIKSPRNVANSLAAAQKRAKDGFLFQRLGHLAANAFNL